MIDSVMCNIVQKPQQSIFLESCFALSQTPTGFGVLCTRRGAPVAVGCRGGWSDVWLQVLDGGRGGAS